MANILIIDDDKNITRLLEITVKRAGYAVTTCADGIEGLAQAETENPDLIVVDVMMPRMTGYDFCKKARSNPVLKDTPIIMFSARFQPIDKQTALEAGATDYLPKTTSPDDLINRITELVPIDEISTDTNVAMGLFSLRGGAGVTSLAVNLSIALALSKKTQIALIDLARLGGHCALMLGLRPTSSVADTLATTSNFTSDAIRPHLIAHKSGVQLLASGHVYGHELSLTDNRLEQLIAALKSGFDYTILDIPHISEPSFASSLKLFDKIVLIISPDMPSLQSTVLALQGLTRLRVAENNIALVVNQVTPHNTLPLEIIQKAIKRPILASIPFEPEMIKAINSGTPLLLNSPKSAGTGAIIKLANALLD